MNISIYRYGLLVLIGIAIGLPLGKSIWHVPTPKDVPSIVSGESEPKGPVLDKTKQFSKNEAKERELIVSEASGPKSSCDLNSYSLSQLKTAYDKKNDDVRRTIISRFTAAKTEREKKERHDALVPLILPLAQESQYWAADWSANISGASISLTLVWFIHEDGKGFGFETFAPDKRQILGLGAGLDYASPHDESWYVLANVTDKKIDQMISQFAFAIPTSKSRTAPTEYLIIDEKNWRSGPEITWRPIPKTYVENMRKDAARRDQLEDAG